MALFLKIKMTALSFTAEHNFKNTVISRFNAWRAKFKAIYLDGNLFIFQDIIGGERLRWTAYKKYKNQKNKKDQTGDAVERKSFLQRYKNS